MAGYNPFESAAGLFSDAYLGALKRKHEKEALRQELATKLLIAQQSLVPKTEPTRVFTKNAKGELTYKDVPGGMKVETAGVGWQPNPPAERLTPRQQMFFKIQDKMKQGYEPTNDEKRWMYELAPDVGGSVQQQPDTVKESWFPSWLGGKPTILPGEKSITFAGQSTTGTPPPAGGGKIKKAEDILSRTPEEIGSMVDSGQLDPLLAKRELLRRGYKPRKK